MPMSWINDVFNARRKEKQRTGNTLFANYQWFSNPMVGKYSDTYFFSLTNKIFKGLDNCRFINKGNSNYIESVADFINREAKHMIWCYWRDGFIVVDYTDITSPFIIDGDVKKNSYGEPIIPTGRQWLIHYSNPYILKRKSDFDILKNELSFLDRLADSLDFLTSTYGSVGIITGKSMPMTAEDKEELNEQLQRNLGITRQRKQFVISKGSDFDIKQFSFDMKGLDLQGKIDRQYLLLADYFGVPKNLLATDVDSTYENQSAALKRFYSDCISPLCEVLLEIGRRLIILSVELIASNELSFVIDNVPEISTDESFVEELKNFTNVINQTEDEYSKALLTNMLRKKIENYQ